MAVEAPAVAQVAVQAVAEPLGCSIEAVPEEELAVEVLVVERAAVGPLEGNIAAALEA